MSWERVPRTPKHNQWHFTIAAYLNKKAVSKPTLYQLISIGEAIQHHLGVVSGDRVWVEFGRGDDCGKVRVLRSDVAGYKLRRLKPIQRTLSARFGANGLEGPHPQVRYDVVEMGDGFVVAEPMEPDHDQA